jgi:hypothetical protein
MEQARKIWNEMIIQRGLGQLSTEWIEFFQFEKEFGDEKHQRKVLLRGLNESNDSKEILCDLLLKFEKQNGTIESYTVAKLKCDKIFNQINAEIERKLVEEEEEKVKQNKKPQQKQPQKEKSKPKQQKQDKDAQNKNLKRKVSN